MSIKSNILTMNSVKLWMSVLMLSILFLPKNLLACHGQPLANYAVVVGATGVTINGSSNPATCGCGPYWMQTEISCSPAFLGTQPSCLTQTLAFWTQVGTTQYVSFPYFNSLLNVPNYNQAANWPDNCATEPYHPTFIPFSGLCPGKTYYIRTREMVMNPPWGGGPGMPFPSYGAWMATQSFVVPGTPPLPGPGGNIIVTLTAAPPVVICGGGVTLTAGLSGNCNSGGCGIGFPTCEANTTITPSYSWAASMPVTPNGFATNTTFTTAAGTPTGNTLFIPNLPSTTTFSVWFYNAVTTSTGTSASTPTSINTSTSVVAGPTSVFGQAVNNGCLTGGTPCTITQPGVVTVQVITILPTSNVSITPNACMSAPSFTISDVGSIPGMMHNWNFGNGNTGVGNPVTQTYSAPGIYTVTLTKSGGPSCTPQITTYTLEVYPNPTNTITVNSPVCIGGTASFTNIINNGNTFSWTGPNGYTSSAPNPIITNVTPNMAGTYTCLTTSVKGCTNIATAAFTTYQATVQATSNSPVCFNTALNFTANPSGGVYNWAGPNAFASNLQNPSIVNVQSNASGIYSLNAVLPGSCIASSTTAVVVNSTAVTASNNGPLCSNLTLQLNANGAGTFVWVGPNGFTSTSQNPTIPNATSVASGIYTVTITSPQGCVATATTNATVKPPKPLSPKGTPSICENGTIYLEALEGEGASYLWTGPNGFNSPNANTLVQSAPLAAGGEYSLTIIDNLGCAAFGRVMVEVNPIPKLGIDMKNAKNGCAPVCDVSYAFSSSHPLASYSWDLGNGQTTTSNIPANLCYQVAKNYIIRISGTDAKGCSNTYTTVLEVYPNPTVDFGTSSGGPTWVNGTMQFNDLTKNATVKSWEWSFGNGGENSTQQNPSYTYQDSGRYEVTLNVISDKGCKGSFKKLIVVEDEVGFYVPNAFTPNGDGNNDLFMPVATNINKYEMLIFNRGGQLIYQTSDSRKGWDGTVKGKLADDNVFVYKITYLDKTGKAKTLTGNLTLIR
jgi:gliding motility-associated-like protein